MKRSRMDMYMVRVDIIIDFIYKGWVQPFFLIDSEEYMM